MDFPVFINKWVIGFKPIKYTPFWFWFRLVNHSNWRMDDHQRYWDFWMSINRGYDNMNYKWEYKNVWSKVPYSQMPKKDNNEKTRVSQTTTNS